MFCLRGLSWAAIKFLPRASWRSQWQTVTSMSNNGEKYIIAVAQMTATNDKNKNFQLCAELTEKAKQRGALVTFLPEGCDFLGESKKETISLAEPLSGPMLSRFKELAKSQKMWLSLGGFHEKNDDERILNSHLLLSDEGEVVAVYHKTHLFDVDIPERKIRLMESSFVLKGKEILPPIESPVGKIGLGICYDMRFPEMSRVLAEMGADILTYPSAFTVSTGLAHWETMLRARAIENQCYVVAAAQTGVHNAKRSSYGHAMIVDPWGAVVAQCSEGMGLATAEIDLGYLRKIREEMPVWQHRRSDLYNLEFLGSKSKRAEPSDEKTFQFGQVQVKGNNVFLETQRSIAFVNRKCVVPGHVLVAPKREALRLSDLNSSEIQDLFVVVQRVQRMIEAHYNATSSTVTIQDGPDAGQTIKHLHVHIIPRKPGDFSQNDEVYRELEKHDKGAPEWREEADMVEEAKRLRKCMQGGNF